MKTRFAIPALLLFLVTCGPGADARSIANSLANVFCHFAYACCTPIERQDFLSVGTSTGDTDFDNESGCDTAIGDQYQDQLQPYEASLTEQRMTYATATAQACLNALSAAANQCSYQSLINASTGDAGCPAKLSDLFTGTVAAGGTCTMDADCALPGSQCRPPGSDGGTTIVVTAEGVCVSPAAVGQPCNTTLAVPCVAGSCCNQGNGGMPTCTAYVATGAACSGFFGQCTNTTCNPSTDYCPVSGSPVCTALQPVGGPCMNSFECQAGLNCNNGTTCQGAPDSGVQVVYQVCTGNKDGI
jgi:hypothetical protein